MIDKTTKMTANTFLLAILAASLVTSALVMTLRTVNAQTPTDQNGIRLVQPLRTFTLTYTGNEMNNPTKNFRSDGSMRLDFKGTGAAMPSLMTASFFKLSPGSCTNFPDEEISPKMNGGPHNDQNPDWADTMDLGLINLAGTDSRFRQEDPHPDYFAPLINGARNDNPTSTTLPVNNNRNMCTVPSTGAQYWVGAMAFKINLDDNCDGKPDRVSIIGYIDTTGFAQPGNHPRNNWELTFKREYTPAQLDKLEGFFQSQVALDGHPQDAYQTWRIDHQNQTDWTDSSPNFMYTTLKEVTAHKNSCP